MALCCNLEESLINGLDTFLGSKKQVKVSFILIFLAIFLHICGFATPHWIDTEDDRIGLWQHCNTATQYECCQSAGNYISQNAWINAARVFLSFGVASGCVAWITISFKTLAKGASRNIPVKNVCIVSCFIAAITIIIGVSVYGGQYKFEPLLKEYHPAASFAISIIAGITFLLCGAILLVGSEGTDVAPENPNQHQRPEPSAPPMDVYAVNTGPGPPPAPAQPSNADNTTDSNTCCVCLDNPIDTLFEPCAHSKCCQACAQTVTSCPICRANITQVRRIFR